MTWRLLLVAEPKKRWTHICHAQQWPSPQVVILSVHCHSIELNVQYLSSQVNVIPISSCHTNHIYPNKNSVPSCPLSPMEFQHQVLQPIKLFSIFSFQLKHLIPYCLRLLMVGCIYVKKVVRCDECKQKQRNFRRLCSTINS